MKNFRLYIGAGHEATSAGCLLALVSVVLTICVCLAFGESFAIWALQNVPWWGRQGLALFVYGVMILPGLVVFWAVIAVPRQAAGVQRVNGSARLRPRVNRSVPCCTAWAFR